MKNMLTLILVLLALQTNAQKIHFTDSANTWNVLIGREIAGQGHITGYSHEDYVNNGDTFLNGKLYTQVWYNGYMPAYFTRQDSTTNKVYLADGGSEVVLYDYNLSVGDTFYAPKISQSSSQVWHIVDSVDSIQINGIFHKRFYLNLHDYNLYSDYFARDYVVTEGIGCSAGPIYPLYGSPGFIGFNERCRGLICFTNGGVAPAIFTNCNDTTLSINKPEMANKQPSVFPQPATTYANIKLLAKIQSGSITVYNQLGQLVHAELISNKEQTRINNPGNWHGVYYYRITDNTSQSLSGKLLFE